MPAVRRLIIMCLVAAASLACGGEVAQADSPSAALLSELETQYRPAVIAHDASAAAQLRTEARLLAVADPGNAALARLSRTLEATSDQYEPWPLASTVAALAERAGASSHDLAPARPYGEVRDSVDAALTAERAGDHPRALRLALGAYAQTAVLRGRLGGGEDGFDATFWATDRAHPGLLVALDRSAPAGPVATAASRVRDALSSAQQSLGDVQISRATVVSDAAILVFREGLEAVLILAAITASFVGAKRHLRRPVLLGGIAGIGATAITWALVQLLISELGTGGLRLEAITGLLAIAVLLVVTNWFFHRVYWSQWISRFNRQRKRLEKVDRFGFFSGQAVGLAILGMTSVYREGFETVLFIQNLQVSAGTSACVLGAGIGLAGTLVVGAITFLAQRKLPYKKMLIATGVLIAVVLAVMTGTTVHVLQGLGWLPSTPTSFTVAIWANSWLGLYATWEGIAAQLLALTVVLGSYFLAREVQVRGPQRRARKLAAAEQAAA